MPKAIAGAPGRPLLRKIEAETTDGQDERRNPALPLHPRGRSGGLLGPPGRPLLGEEGPARLVDPQGPVRRGRGPARGGETRIPRRDGFRSRRQLCRAGSAPTARRQDGPRLGAGGRLRRGGDRQQHLCHGVAAAVRGTAGVPGGGPSGLVFGPGGSGANRSGTGGVPAGAQLPLGQGVPAPGEHRRTTWAGTASQATATPTRPPTWSAPAAHVTREPPRAAPTPTPGPPPA